MRMFRANGNPAAPSSSSSSASSSMSMSAATSSPTSSSSSFNVQETQMIFASARQPTPCQLKAQINGVPFEVNSRAKRALLDPVEKQRPVASAKDDWIDLNGEIKYAFFPGSSLDETFEQQQYVNEMEHDGHHHDSYMELDRNEPQRQKEEMTFYKETFLNDCMKMMYIMRSHRMLTDVELEVGTSILYAHKVVLASSSPYFKAMFTGGLKETEMARVKLEGVCPTSVDRLINFMYTGRVRVTEETVCTLLPAATMLQVTHVVDACCLFLEKQLDPTNAIGIAKFAEQYCCWKLSETANQYVVHHFSSIAEEEEFLQLSGMQLVNLVRSDDLDVQEEKDVYNAVLKWVSYREDDRSSKMEHILHAVRCQYLTPNFLREQMKNCDLLKKMPACKEYLARIFKDLTLHIKPPVQRRTPKAKRIIFVAGGFRIHSLDTLEAYNVDEGTWTKLASLLLPRSGLGGVFLKGFFYAIGGRNNHPSNGGRFDSNWVDRYDPITNSWRPCSPLSTARNRVSVAVMDDLIYAIGGSYNQEYHNTVEYYDPDTDQWNRIAPMNTARLATGVAVVNRLLYAIGGFNGSQRLNTVECYHPENGEWSFVAPMKYARSGAGIASIGQYIYVAGGFNGTGQITSLERYDTETNTWEELSPLPSPRSALTLTVVDHLLYAIGGFDGSKFCECCLIYNTRDDTWSEGMKMNEPKSGHASALFYQRCGHQCGHIESMGDALQASSSS